MKKIEYRKKGVPDFLEAGQIFCVINKENDVNINGSITIMGNDYNDHETMKVYANLCNDAGEILLVMSNYNNYNLKKNNYYTFELFCADVSRFFEPAELAYAEIYIVFDE